MHFKQYLCPQYSMLHNFIVYTFVLKLNMTSIHATTIVLLFDK